MFALVHPLSLILLSPCFLWALFFISLLHHSAHLHRLGGEVAAPMDFDVRLFRLYGGTRGAECGCIVFHTH